MQTREQGMKNNAKRGSVEGQHHQYGAALVKGEVKNIKLSKGIQCEKMSINGVWHYTPALCG